MQKVVVRFAPSPTGGCHLGGIRTALFNYLFAKKHGGTFFMRIEDTDNKRFDSAAEDHIKAGLSWLGITPDFETEKQSERAAKGIYDIYVKQLIDSGHAYYAFDTAEELSNARLLWKDLGHRGGYNHVVRMRMRNSLSLSSDEVQLLLKNNTPYTIRYKIEPGCSILVDDIIKGKCLFNSSEMDDKVLVKTNGIPTYHLANVVDDHLMGVSHVIRGDEWLTSASLHMLLYRDLGWTAPLFAHLPLVLSPDGKEKLSKRNALKLGYTVFLTRYKGIDSDGEDIDIQGFADMGYEPTAMLNFLSLVGWHPSGEKEILTLDEIINEFSLEKCSKSGARFDFDKLNHFNFEYVKKIPNTELVPIEKFTKYSIADFTQIANWTKERAPFRKDASITWKPFVEAPIKDIALITKTLTTEAELVWKRFLKDSQEIEWTKNEIEKLLLSICDELKIKKGKTLPFLRTALTGGLPGPDLLESMQILGKTESNNRLLDALTEKL